MPRKPIPITQGQRFGRWEALEERQKGVRLIRCRCDCGTEKSVMATSLLCGDSKSCGCIAREDNEVSKRFWSSVDRNGPVPSHVPSLGPCWAWIGGGKRYGRFWINDKNESAHRAVWMLVNGSIPDGLFVLHACDKIGCVNPNHLFLGTSADNNQDAASKGRTIKTQKGKMYHNSRLTLEEVAQIRTAKGLHKDIADRFGIARSYVSRIRSGTKLSHI